MGGVKKRVPKRRFKEFLNSSDWDQRKLGDVSNIIVGGTPSTKVKAYWEPKEVPWMSSGEINKKRIYSTDNMISEYGLNNSNARWVKENSILIALAGQGKTRGTVAINDIPLTTNQSIAAMELNKDFDAEFIFQNLNSRYEELRRVSSGDGTRGGLNKEILSNFVVPYTSISEQVKIGNFFRTIDNLIIRCQRKLDKLQATKKALLQEMFPEEEQDKPKRRFKGFTDAWEQRKLGDLAEIVRGASPRPISDPKWFDNDSSVGWLRIADVTAQDGRIRYLEQKISELGQEKTRVIKTPHLLLSIAATVGKPVINYVPTGVHDGFLIFLNPKFNILYTFWWLEMFREKWNKYGQPGSQVNLNSDLVKNQVINIPNEKEQDKISSFLESLDKIITLHQRKLDKLKNLKQAYLNEMFV